MSHIICSCSVLVAAKKYERVERWEGSDAVSPLVMVLPGPSGIVCSEGLRALQGVLAHTHIIIIHSW